MADQKNEELMIQLPWTVPQQPLYTAQIPVNPETQKIPLDLSHSTDTTAIWITGLSFIVTAFIVYLSTKQQIKSNKELINTQIKLNHEERLETLEKEWKLKITDNLSNLYPVVGKYIILLGAINFQNIEYSQFIKNIEYEEMRDEMELIQKDLDFLLMSTNITLRLIVEKDNLLITKWIELENLLITFKACCITNNFDNVDLVNLNKDVYELINGFASEFRTQLQNKRAA